MADLRERLARALGSIAAGFSIAVEHLRDQAPDPEPILPIELQPCPVCGASLLAGPHVHATDVFWPTEHPGAVLVSGLDGGDTLVINNRDNGDTPVIEGAA